VLGVAQQRGGVASEGGALDVTAQSVVHHVDEAVETSVEARSKVTHDGGNDR
jgi:hypothetical protein